jgi:hypothetical protein
MRRWNLVTKKVDFSRKFTEPWSDLALWEPVFRSKMAKDIERDMAVAAGA